MTGLPVKRRIADPQNMLLRAIAPEMGKRIADLRPAVLHQVQVALVEAYRRGAQDAHDRSTLKPPDANEEMGEAETLPPSGQKA